MWIISVVQEVNMTSAGQTKCGEKTCWWWHSATRDQCYCSGTESTGVDIQRGVCRLFTKTSKEEQQSTFGTALPQLSILDEPSKHLRLHEDAQETTDAFRRHRLAEGLSLENTLSALVLSDEQGVMADGLQEEADEGLWHKAVQGVILCRHKWEAIIHYTH